MLSAVRGLRPMQPPACSTSESADCNLPGPSTANTAKLVGIAPLLAQRPHLNLRLFKGLRENEGRERALVRGSLILRGWKT